MKSALYALHYKLYHTCFVQIQCNYDTTGIHNISKRDGSEGVLVIYANAWNT
jgi:hypothetical protein